MASPRYSTTWPWPPPVPILRDEREDQVLGGDAGRQRRRRRRPPSSCGRGSGSVWVASTCSTSLVPMPKASAPNAPWVVVCESPQTIVMPGLGEAELRADDVHDALARRRPSGAAGRRTRRSCGAASRPGWRDTGSAIGSSMPIGRHVVVLGGEGEVGPAHRAAGQPQPVEGLRAGHLVHEVQVDVEQVRLAVGAPHDVRLPDLLGQRAGHVAPTLDISHSGMAVSVHGNSMSGVGVLDKAVVVLARPRDGASLARRTGRADRAAAGDRAPAGAGPGGPPAAGARPAGRWRARARGWASSPARARRAADRGRAGAGPAARRAPARARSSTCATATSGSAWPRPSGPAGCATPCRSAPCCR